MNCVIFLLLLGGSMILGALTGQFLLGDYQVSFALAFGVLAFLCGIFWPSRPLPNGGSIRYERLEGIGYTAQDGRFCAMDFYSVRDNHYTLRIADRWGFNNGPPLTEADLQMVLADIIEDFCRNRWAFTVIGRGGEVLASSVTAGQGAARPLP